MSKKWIQKAIKHPGALHRQLGVPQGQKIPESKLNAAAKKSGVLGRRARLAKTLKKMPHGSGPFSQKEITQGYKVLEVIGEK
jgi:hypothetical protein